MKSGVLTALLISSVGCGRPDIERIRSEDLEGALAAFRSNIAAIHQRDTESYLAHYLDSPWFVVANADSVRMGFLAFAETRRNSDTWPDTLIAGEPTLAWIAPGVVYGAYPYTVTIEGSTTSGWSERVFVRTGGGWKIAVTSVIQRVGES